MKHLRLHKLSLDYFQGVPRLDFSPNGEAASIYGDNGVGKTTVASAFCWLLTGKDSLGRGDFAIKPHDSTGQDIHHLNSVVEGVFEFDGAQLVLKKDFHEVWTKKRGSAQPELSTHTVDHVVDGVPCLQKDFQAKVADIADPEMIRLLTDPTYFAETLHWTKRSAQLLKFAAHITDDVVIASDPDLHLLPALLGKHTVAEQRKICQSTRKEVNKALDSVPLRIDEARRSVLAALPDTSLDKELVSQLETVIHERQADLARLDAGSQDAELRARIREAEAELTAATANAQAAARKTAADATIAANAGRMTALQAVEAARATVSQLEAAVPPLESQAKTKRAEVDRLAKELQALRDRWDALDAQVFAGSTHCPTCQQELPADQLEAARARFNAQRSTDLEQVEAEGKAKKAEYEAAEAERQTLSQQAMDTARQLVDARAKLQKAEAAVPAAVVIEPEPAASPEMDAVGTKLQQLKDSLTSLAVDTSERDRVATELQQAQQDLKAARARIEAAAQQVLASQKAEARVKELAEEQTRLATEFERLERELDLLDRFERAQARMVEESVNGHFERARFRLFREQMNGGLEPCCDVTDREGTPYGAGLNTGERINIGLDIIRALGELHGLTLPVFVDNAESVTDLIQIPAQVIRLVVSKPDKNLRVEHDSQRANLKGVAA
ncbi:MAG: hypothetical protein KC518_13260 [Candidatus Cloacimonetes bacterium]|nr:hypothetical protein [Candidatus Cloacimonadota bacterium]